MGLFGMVARTAVIAGTATAVSNNVSRRQQTRWQRKADADAYQEQQQAAPAYAQPPAQPYQQAPAPAYPPPAEQAPKGITEQLQQLADMKSSGLLTDEEFEKAKSRLLSQ